VAHVNQKNLTSFVTVDATPFNVQEFNIITYLIISFNGLEPMISRVNYPQLRVKFPYSS
jgi:hypothetical protein